MGRKISQNKYVKRAARVMGAFCALILVVFCVSSYLKGRELDAYAKSTSTGSSAVTNETIKEKQNEIASAQEEKKDLKDKISNLESIRKNLEKKKNDLAAYVAEIDASIKQMQDNIDALNEQIEAKEAEITAKQAEIEETRQELEEAEQTEQAQHDAMVIRIRMMYEKGDEGAYEALLASRSFRDLVNRADYIERVVAYDHKMWDDFKAVVAYVALCKQQLELEEQQLELENEILEESKAAVETEKAAMEELQAEKEKELKLYESEIGNTEEEIREYEAAVKQMNAEIAALEAVIAAEKKKLLEGATKITYDGGTFKFPLATYTRISDDYGWRTHPILKTQQYHNGVDFASPYGTAIYAAYDGKVVSAAYSSTMGNYVMIDHGDNLYTIYMHASSLNVSTGDTVVKGDTIAKVGSTGRSTGNHLHFSVRLDGEYVSPWNYLSQ